MSAASITINTRQQALLDALRSSDDEMSGQQLHRHLEKQSPMGLATVYRNLRVLQQRGIVRCRHLPSGEALYAPMERDQHHLTCVDCGKTQPLDHCPIHGINVPQKSMGDFDLLFHTLEFFGICTDCRNRQTSLT
tara:strand:+ start:2024 stop:2428 length:405 start_codon:yes stop_codon:yes gene_type:complete